MTRAHKVWIIAVVVAVGAWGCSQDDTKAVSSRHLEKVKALEARCASLEKECQDALAARDHSKQMMEEIEKERVRLGKQLETGKAVAQERDDLKSLVTTRTTERDSFQAQLEELRKGIRTLLTRVESALPGGENNQEKTSMSPRL